MVDLGWGAGLLNLIYKAIKRQKLTSALDAVLVGLVLAGRRESGRRFEGLLAGEAVLQIATRSIRLL
jgi:hypothetical protein